MPRDHRRPGKPFTPDYGKIAVYRSAAGFGIRLDAGTAYAGAVITPYYDSLLVKVTAWGHTRTRRPRAWTGRLREFRVRGLSTNLQFLENVIAHPLFRSGECTTRFIDDHAGAVQVPEAARPRDPPAEVPRRSGGQRQPGDEGPQAAQAALSAADQARVRPDRADSQRHARPLKELGAQGFASG
jgi:pyruvate carboxylase